MFDLGADGGRFYLRYSKTYEGKRAWYGIRKQDMVHLEGRKSFIVLIWEAQALPLILPYEEYGEVLRATPPSPDGQYKIHVFYDKNGAELYVPRAGRYPVSDNFGWENVENALDPKRMQPRMELTHAQVQTMLGAIGDHTGHSVWIPKNDRGGLDWVVADRFDCIEELVEKYRTVKGILEEIDVVWLERGSGEVKALYEVEHTTSIYSGLLRFNDILLTTGKKPPRFNIVADGIRKAAFSNQLGRPTFQVSGLGDLCGFLDYRGVNDWYKRTVGTPLASN